MTADLLAAWLHFLAAFTLAGALFAQMVLLSMGPDRTMVRRMARLDAIYGVSAALVLIGGVLRVAYGARGAAFYMENPFFHLKITLFLVAALLSIWPTIMFFKWRAAAKADPDWQPAAAQVKRARMITHIELTLIALIILAAGLMTRFYAL